MDEMNVYEMLCEATPDEILGAAGEAVGELCGVAGASYSPLSNVARAVAQCNCVFCRTIREMEKRDKVRGSGIGPGDRNPFPNIARAVAQCNCVFCRTIREMEKRDKQK